MKKILLIEDDADVAEAVSLVLTAEDYHVYHYEQINSFEQIGQIVTELQPQVILSDIFLPGIDGRELCRFLKQQDDYSGIPIILYSAGNFNQQQILDVCADAFLKKPFDIAQLFTTIEELLPAHKE